MPTTRSTVSLTAAVLAALYGPHALSDDGALEEVVVTATRRAVSAQDLPISITAVSGAALEQAGITDVAGLARSLAGVDFTDKGPFSGIAGANLIIRGLNSDPTGGLPGAATPIVAPVATYVDDTPLFVNLRLDDLDRVEILRGPQGTLYGSGSLGGTIRFVQRPPDPTAFDAKLRIGVSATAHTDAPNEEIAGMLNVPLSETLALRANAGWTYDAGFINQPNLYRLDASGAPLAAQPGNLFSPPGIYAQNHANDYQYRSARLAALWKPSEDFRAQLAYYYQLGTAGGFPYVATSTAAYNQPISPATQPTGNFTNPPLATQLYDAPPPAGVDRLANADNGSDTTRDRVDLAALTFEVDLGFATLTSASSWAHHVNHTAIDETAEYVNFYFYQSLYGQNPRSFIKGYEELDDRSASQELRLVSKGGARLDWLAGFFYRDEKTGIGESDYYRGYLGFYNACAPVYGQSSGDGMTPSYCGIGETAYTPGSPNSTAGLPINLDQAYVNTFDTKFYDLALFGELTVHATSAWSLTGGARLFKQTLSQNQQNALLFDGPGYAASGSQSDEWRRVLGKINTALQLSPTNLVYATWSQGFRRGSVNALPPSELAGSYVTPAALAKVAPDTADNYEVGAKGSIQNRFRYTAAIYDIQWHNIQEGVDLTPLVLPGSLNIGNGYSRGLELEFDGLVMDRLHAHLDYTYDQTKLTSVNKLFQVPNTSFAPPAVGSPLPGTPKSSIAAGLDYGDVPLAGGRWHYGVDAHYQSAVLPALSATARGVPGFTLLNTRLSYARSHWLTTLLVNNVANVLGITSYQDPALFGNRNQAIVSQPRTVGISVAYKLSEP